MKLGTVSIDLDTERHHLRGYGYDGGENGQKDLLGVSVARWLDLLQDLRIKATFFAVGEDVLEQPALFRDIVAKGHEVASHSMTHPMRFLDLPAADLETEITRSYAVIGEATGKAPVGFRAPNFELNKAMIRKISSAGYLYDATLFPGLFFSVRMLICLLKGNRPTGLRGRLKGFRSPELVDEALLEFPLATMPATGFPFYSTLLFTAGPRIFHAAYALAKSSFFFFSFICHAIDLLSLEDDLDGRLAVHPGVRTNLDLKTGRMKHFIGQLKHDFSLNTFESHIGTLKRSTDYVRSRVQLLHG